MEGLGIGTVKSVGFSLCSLLWSLGRVSDLMGSGRVLIVAMAMAVASFAWATARSERAS